MPPMVGTFKPTSIVAMDGATQVAAIESFNVGSADRFRAVNAVQFSGHWESAYQDADFSLLILSGFNTVSGILQVRRILNSGRVYYNTQLHHGAGLSQTMRYGICALEDAILGRSMLEQYICGNAKMLFGIEKKSDSI